MTLHPDELEALEGNETFGKSFLELMEGGFYDYLLDSHLNLIWHLSFSPDKSKIFAESPHQPSFTYDIPNDKSKFERDFLGFLKVDPNEILNLPDVPIYQKAKDFVRKKLEQLAQSGKHPFSEWGKAPLTFP